METFPAPENPSRPLLRASEHVASLARSLDALSVEATRIDALGGRLADRLVSGARCLVAGNGGSAAHAQHLTAELVGRYRNDHPPLAAIALHADTSTVTALVNDYPPEQVFARQVTAFGHPGDILVCISSSGRSPNLVVAARAAQALGVEVWSLTGPGPSPLAEVSDEVITADSDYAPTVQEVHQVVVHLLAAAVEAALP